LRVSRRRPPPRARITQMSRWLDTPPSLIARRWKAIHPFVDQLTASSWPLRVIGLRPPVPRLVVVKSLKNRSRPYRSAISSRLAPGDQATETTMST
jgi:hypothetical protein